MNWIDELFLLGSVMTMSAVFLKLQFQEFRPFDW